MRMLAVLAAVPTDARGLARSGFNSSGSLASTVTGQPAYYWDAGIPNNPINPPFFNPSYGIGFILASAPGAAAIGAGPSTAQTLVYGDPEKGGQAPQYQDFFLNIQHSFGPNMTLSVAYSGSAGRYLPGAGVAGPFTNQIPGEVPAARTAAHADAECLHYRFRGCDGIHGGYSIPELYRNGGAGPQALSTVQRHQQPLAGRRQIFL